MDYRILKKIAFIKFLLSLPSRAARPPRAPVDQKKGNYGYLKEYMAWLIRKEMKQNNIVGLSIALVDDQTIVWRQGFGYADRENKIKATPVTLYRAGSISKVFNAMAVMKLVETGKMDIDRPLVIYLPEFKINSRFGNTDGITPRTIMTHHSGLPGDWIDGMWVKLPKPFTQVVHAIKDEYVAYPPNTIMSYSNLGVTLLGHAVQNASGQEYAQFLDQSVLKPMGMNASRFATSINGDAAAHSYRKGKRVIEYPLRDLPAGGLNTTVADLARLAMLINNWGRLENRQILSPGSVSAMLTVQNNDIPFDFGVKTGLAWGIDNNLLAGKESVYEHSGGVIAHRAMFMVAPKSKLGVAVLANTSSADTHKLAQKILRMAWESKNGVKLPQKKRAFVKTHSDLRGTFATMIGKVDVFLESKNHYKVKSSAGNFSLKLAQDHQYHPIYRLLGFLPVDLEELGAVGLTTENVCGHHALVAEFDHLRFLAGVKVDPHPIHDAWKNRLGRYTLLNALEPEIFQIKDFELKIENNHLLALITFHEDARTEILRTIDADTAIVEGLGRSLGETIRLVRCDEGGEILSYSGLRFKRKIIE
jgi:CubicO group peptidase (beta-lactamase class C family)